LIRLALIDKNSTIHRSLSFLFVLLPSVLFQDACYSQVAKQPEYVVGEGLQNSKFDVDFSSLHKRLSILLVIFLLADPLSVLEGRYMISKKLGLGIIAE